MKSGLIAVVVAGVVLVVGITYAFVNHPERTVVQSAAAEEMVHTEEEASRAVGVPEEVVEVMNVDELAEAPEKFPSEVTLRAVVAGVNESEGVFSVIDSREFEKCGVLTCARYYLPVKVEGELPKPKALLEITGKVVRSEKGLVFEANQMEAAR